MFSLYYRFLLLECVFIERDIDYLVTPQPFFTDHNYF